MELILLCIGFYGEIISLMFLPLELLMCEVKTYYSVDVFRVKFNFYLHCIFYLVCNFVFHMVILL